MSSEQHSERCHTFELGDERKAAVQNDTSDSDTVKRRKKSPEIEPSHSLEVREEKNEANEETSDTETFKRKKQLPEEDGLKSSSSDLWSPRGVRQLRRSWESIKVKAKRTQSSYSRQRLKSVGGSPEKLDVDVVQALGIIADDNATDLESTTHIAEPGLLSRAFSVPSNHHFSPVLDQDMLDHMSDREVSDNEMSDHILSDNKMSDREASDHNVSDQEMSNQEKSDLEMSPHGKLDQTFSHLGEKSDQDELNHEKSDVGMLTREKYDHEMSDSEQPQRHNLTSRLLRLKLKHYENIVNHEQEQHDLEMRVKQAQLDAAVSQKVACEEVGRTAVTVRDSIQSVCRTWEHTAQSLQKMVELYLERNINNL